jgi:hypothetical protein
VAGSCIQALDPTTGTSGALEMQVAWPPLAHRLQWSMGTGGLGSSVQHMHTTPSLVFLCLEHTLHTVLPRMSP